MSKKTYILAIVSFLLIPAAAVVGAFVFDAINPEIAAGHPDYVRNYRLLDLAKHLSLLAALLVIAGLWFLTGFFLVKSKNRSYSICFGRFALTQSVACPNCGPLPRALDESVDPDRGSGEMLEFLGEFRLIRLPAICARAHHLRPVTIGCARLAP